MGLLGTGGDSAGPNIPGVQKIIFKPYLPPDLPWAKASLKTPYGIISSHWQRNGATAKLKICVPAHCTATVHIPVKDPNTVTVNKKALSQSDSIALLGSEEGETRIVVGSGKYALSFPDNLDIKSNICIHSGN